MEERGEKIVNRRRKMPKHLSSICFIFNPDPQRAYILCALVWSVSFFLHKKISMCDETRTTKLFCHFFYLPSNIHRPSNASSSVYRNLRPTHEPTPPHEGMPLITPLKPILRILIDEDGNLVCTCDDGFLI